MNPQQVCIFLTLSNYWQSCIDFAITVITVVVIEHNLDVIKTADWIIDLGPEGGSGGGQIFAEGTPEEVSHVKGSHTGKFLKTTLQK